MVQDASTLHVQALDLPSLVENYASLLFRVANSIVRNQAEAEDVVQDTFVRVLEHRATLPAVRELRPWLVRIAWNLALDRRRGTRPAQMDELFAATLVARTVPADRVLAETRRMEQTLRALDRLPPPERQVLLLSAVDELPTAELAAVLGKSESAVRALLFRARTRLRQRLEKAGYA